MPEKMANTYADHAPGSRTAKWVNVMLRIGTWYQHWHLVSALALGISGMAAGSVFCQKLAPCQSTKKESIGTEQIIFLF